MPEYIDTLLIIDTLHSIRAGEHHDEHEDSGKLMNQWIEALSVMHIAAC